MSAVFYRVPHISSFVRERILLRLHTLISFKNWTSDCSLVITLLVKKTENYSITSYRDNVLFFK